MSFVKNVVDGRGFIEQLSDEQPQYAMYVSGNISASNVNSNAFSSGDYPRIFVSMSGSDATGDGSFSNPFKTPVKAIEKIYSYQKPVGYTESPGYMVMIMPGFEGPWGNGDQYYQYQTFDPILYGPYGSYLTSGSIIFTPYFTDTNLGTVNDERFVTLKGPLTPVSIGSTASRPAYSFPTGSFGSADEHLGRVVRVFTDGVERFRGVVAKQQVNNGGFDKLVVSVPEGSFAIGYTAITASINDVVYITKPSVKFTDIVSVYNNNANVLFSGLEFTTLYHNGNNTLEKTTEFVGCYVENGQEQPFINSSGHCSFGNAKRNYNIAFAKLYGDDYLGAGLPLSTGFTVDEQMLWDGWNCGIIGPGYGAGNVRACGVFGGTTQMRYCVTKGDIAVFQNDEFTTTLVLYAPILRGGIVASNTTLTITSDYPYNLGPVLTHRFISTQHGSFCLSGKVSVEIETATLPVLRVDNSYFRNDIAAVPYFVALSTSMTGSGTLVTVTNTPFFRINAASSTIHGTGGTSDVKVGSLAAASFSTLNLSGSNGIVDLATLTRVGT